MHVILKSSVTIRIIRDVYVKAIEIDYEFENKKEENLRHQGVVMEDFLERKLI